MLKQIGHSLLVDLYSLGAILYEMITGLPPHYSTNRDEMYEKILYEPLTFPPEVSTKAKHLMASLLVKNPKQRMGHTKGIEEVKVHPWCTDIDWEKYLQKEIKPPFKPNLSSSNFDPEYTSIPLDEENDIDLSMVSLESNAIIHDDKYNEFSYIKNEESQFIDIDKNNEAYQKSETSSLHNVSKSCIDTVAEEYNNDASRLRITNNLELNHKYVKDFAGKASVCLKGSEMESHELKTPEDILINPGGKEERNFKTKISKYILNTEDGFENKKIDLKFPKSEAFTYVPKYTNSAQLPAQADEINHAFPHDPKKNNYIKGENNHMNSLLHLNKPINGFSQNSIHDLISKTVDKRISNTTLAEYKDLPKYKIPSDKQTGSVTYMNTTSKANMILNQMTKYKNTLQAPKNLTSKTLLSEIAPENVQKTIDFQIATCKSYKQQLINSIDASKSEKENKETSKHSLINPPPKQPIRQINSSHKINVLARKEDESMHSQNSMSSRNLNPSTGRSIPSNKNDSKERKCSKPPIQSQKINDPKYLIKNLNQLKATTPKANDTIKSDKDKLKSILDSIFSPKRKNYSNANNGFIQENKSQNPMHISQHKSLSRPNLPGYSNVIANKRHELSGKKSFIIEKVKDLSNVNHTIDNDKMIVQKKSGKESVFKNILYTNRDDSISKKLSLNIDSLIRNTPMNAKVIIQKSNKYSKLINSDIKNSRKNEMRNASKGKYK